MNRAGIALVATLGVLVVVGLLVFGSFFTTTIEQSITRNDVLSTQANYVAQAGLQKYKAALFQNYRWMEQKMDEAEAASSGSTICLSSINSGIDFDRTGTPTAFDSNNAIGPITETVSSASGLVIGSYDVKIYRSTTNSQIYTIESVGTSGGARSKVRAVFQLANTGYLDNAIFAGSGQANKFINGGAEVRGGIYIVGDPASPSTYVIESNGNFTMSNEYNLADYGTTVTSKVNSANQVASNLCATLRVQYGKVSVGGSTLMGSPTNKLKGVYVSSGSSNINGNAADVCTKTKGICTDPPPGAFDLANPPEFPTLGGNGNCDTLNNPTWRQCIEQDATRNGGLMINRTATGSTLGNSQNTTLNSTGCLTTFGSTQSVTLQDQTVNCTFTRNGYLGGFSYDGSTNPATLTVYDTVNLVGYDLIFGKAVNYIARTGMPSSGTATTTTTNNAAIVVQAGIGGGNLRFNGNMLPDTTGSRYYPQHVLGFVAENNVRQEGQYVMAPIYSGGIFRLVKDNVLFGSIVTDMFCTTSAGQDACNAGQKSKIVYVNTGNFKPGIMRQPERYTTPVFKVLSYERR